jgi:hypothetical protein
MRPLFYIGMAPAAQNVALSVNQRLVRSGMGPVAEETPALLHGLMNAALLHELAPVVTAVTEVLLAFNGELFVVRLVGQMTRDTQAQSHGRMDGRRIEFSLVMALIAQIRRGADKQFVIFGLVGVVAARAHPAGYGGMYVLF